MRVPAQTTPYWLDAKTLAPENGALKGVRVQVRPASPAMSLAARAAAGERFRSILPADADLDRMAPESQAIISRASFLAAEEFAIEFLTIGIVAWKGVEDAAGKPLPVTPAGIRQGVMSIPLFDFLDRFYVSAATAPDADAEKNGSSPSPNGTGGAKTRAKRTAATARNRAQPARTA